MNTENKKLLSVIICSRNRVDELVHCLPVIAEQASLFPDTEVIIVDNGSTDNTKQVIQEQSALRAYPFRYVYEPVPGLSQARNRGRKEALGSTLAFIDDDVIIKENWINRIRKHFIEKKSDCLGGKITVEMEGKMPLRFDKNMEWFFMSNSLGDQARSIYYPEHPTGCNMAFTTDVFDKVGGFNTNLKLYGDEHDFFRRAAELTVTMYYDPAVLVSQLIPAYRITKKELKSKSYKWGEGAATAWMLSDSSGIRRLIKAIEYIARSCYMMGVLLFKKDFGRFYTYWYNRGYLAKLIRGLESKRVTR